MPNIHINRRILFQKTSVAAIVYDADAQLYFNQLTGTISDSWKFYVNKYIVQLKADNNWVLDRLWLHATENQQNARISMRNPTSTALTEVNSLTWTSGQGYTGNGTTMYANANCSPSTAGNFSLNSACFGAYLRTNTNTSCDDIGTFNGTTSFAVLRARVSNLLVGDLNDNTGHVVANTDSRGLFAMNRSSSTTTNLWKNGAIVNTSAANNSTSLSTQNFYLLARNSNGVAVNFSDRQQSLTFLGDNTLTQSTFYTATQTLMTDLGINV